VTYESLPSMPLELTERRIGLEAKDDPPPGLPRESLGRADVHPGSYRRSNESSSEVAPRFLQARHMPQDHSPSKFFIAHSKACGDLEIDELRRITTVMLGVLARGQPFEIVMGRDYFHARFKAAGSWDAWSHEVATAVSYITREPIFKAILVPEGSIGAGTAKIVKEALAVRKPVFTFNRGGQWTRIVGVEVKNSDDWQGGWGLLQDERSA